MNRKQFIKTSLITSVGLSIFPGLSFTSASQPYTRNQLIGKGNPDITGNSYTSTMHQETAKALANMSAEAAKEGIAIAVVSAYRSFQRQKEIYEGKYQRFTGQGLAPLEAIQKIIEYSTIPGTSRHHWGTDLDLIDANTPRPKSVLQAEHFHGKGPFCKFKEWMDHHAHAFGFYEVYTQNAQRKGFAYEPWHFSYAPVAIPMLQAYKQLDLKSILQEEQIAGSQHFTTAFLDTYRTENILDINPLLL